jgi:hypothetical protein
VSYTLLKVLYHAEVRTPFLATKVGNGIHNRSFAQYGNAYYGKSTIPMKYVCNESHLADLVVGYGLGVWAPAVW